MFSFKFREMLYHISGISQIKEKPAHITVCKIDDKVYKKGSVFFQLHRCVFLLAAHSSEAFHGSSCFTICSSVKSAVFAVFSSPCPESVRVELVLHRSLNQAVNHSTGLCTCLRICKQPVLSAHHKRLDAPLCAIVGQLRSAVLQIIRKVRPLIDQECKRFAKSRFRRSFVPLQICPCKHSVKNRFRLFLPLFQSFFCIFFRKTVFDPKEQVAVFSWT